MDKINGWLLIDKPYKASSASIVNKINYLLKKQSKVGHAGTLDPLAQGLLPIALGEATKTCQYITNEDKEYVFTVQWGFATASGDLDGIITELSEKRPCKEEIIDIIPRFLGKISQVPSIYSAIKINGVPSYKLARNGIVAEIKPRIVEIFSLNLEDFQNHKATFRVKCSKGTYVRSLAQDIATSLNTCGCVVFLNRTQVGSFSLKYAITLANLNNLLHNSSIDRYLLPIDQGLGDILAIDLSDEQIIKIRNGLQIYSENFVNYKDFLARVRYHDKLQALIKINEGFIKPLRIFNL